MHLFPISINNFRLEIITNDCNLSYPLQLLNAKLNLRMHLLCEFKCCYNIYYKKKKPISLKIFNFLNMS